MSEPPFSPSPDSPRNISAAESRVRPRTREIGLEDLDALYELDRLCFEPGIAYSRSEIRRFLRLATVQSLAIEGGPDDRIAGFAIGYLSRRGVGNVLTLDVHPDHRRAGAGHRLLTDLLERLRGSGAERFVLEVDVRNGGAIAFYERFGFQKVARIPDYYGAGRDAFRMELESRS